MVANPIAVPEGYESFVEEQGKAWSTRWYLCWPTDPEIMEVSGELEQVRQEYFRPECAADPIEGDFYHDDYGRPPLAGREEDGRPYYAIPALASPLGVEELEEIIEKRFPEIDAGTRDSLVAAIDERASLPPGPA